MFADELKEFFNTKIMYLDIEDNTLVERLSKRNQNGGSELEHDIKQNKDKIILAKKIEKDIISYLRDNTKIEVRK